MRNRQLEMVLLWNYPKPFLFFIGHLHFTLLEGQKYYYEQNHVDYQE